MGPYCHCLTIIIEKANIYKDGGFASEKLTLWRASTLPIEIFDQFIKAHESKQNKDEIVQTISMFGFTSTTE